MTERYVLPVWLRKGANVTRLYGAFVDWWDNAESWIKTPLDQMDPQTCHAITLKHHAYQNDIERFSNEPEELFRKRVAFAAENAIDAGSVVGFVNIFERLGIGYVEVEERADPENWDVISLRLSDSQVSSNTDLLGYIIQQYGRTCRRYELTVITPINIGIQVGAVGNVWDLDVATI